MSDVINNTITLGSVTATVLFTTHDELGDANMRAQLAAAGTTWVATAGNLSRNPVLSATAYTANLAAMRTGSDVFILDSLRATEDINPVTAIQDYAASLGDLGALLGNAVNMVAVFARTVDPIPVDETDELDVLGNELTIGGVGVGLLSSRYATQPITFSVNLFKTEITQTQSLLNDQAITISGAARTDLNVALSDFSKSLNDWNSSDTADLSSDLDAAFGAFSSVGQSLSDVAKGAGISPINIVENSVSNDQIDILDAGSNVIEADVASISDDGKFITETSQQGDETNSEVYSLPANGGLVEKTAVSSNGVATFDTVDPVTKKTLYTIHEDGTGNVTGTFSETDISFDQIMSATLDTLATQLITNVLIKNNVPAAVAAQALADAAIRSALLPPGLKVGFSTQFAESVFGIVGGLLGSDVGGLIAKSFGLPEEAGTLVGGTTGNLLGQSIISEVGKELGFATDTADIFTVTTFAEALDVVGDALGSTGAVFAASELASLIVPTTTAGSITGAVATAATEAILYAFSVTDPLILIGASFVSDFIGSLIGSVVGNHHPSVGPDGGALIGYSQQTGKFFLVNVGVDNGLDPAPIRQMGQNVVSILNAVRTMAGGTATNSNTSGFWNGQGTDNYRGAVLQFTVGYFKGQFYFARGNQYPQDFPNTFASPDAAIGYATVQMMKAMTFSGGNAYVEQAIRNSPATNLNDFLADVQSASDYSTYVIDPEAWNLKLALSSDPIAALTLWTSELQRLPALGIPFSTVSSAITMGPVGFANQANGLQDILFRDNTGNLSLFEGLKGHTLTQVATGTNNTLDFSGRAINVLNNVALTVRGSGNTVRGSIGTNLTIDNAGANARADTVTMDWGTLSLTANSVATLFGGCDFVNFGDGSHLNIGAGSGGLTLTGNRSTITFDTSKGPIGFNIGGTLDTINVSKSTFGIAAGANDVVNGMGNTITLGNMTSLASLSNYIKVGANSSIWINGANNTVYLSQNDRSFTNGKNTFIVGNAMTERFTTGGNVVDLSTGDLLYTDGNEIHEAAGSTDRIIGGNNDDLVDNGGTVEVSNGTNSIRNIVNTPGATIIADANANILVVGRSPNIEMHNGATVAASASVFNFGTNITGTFVAGWGDTINATSGDDLTLQNVGNNPTDYVNMRAGILRVADSSTVTLENGDSDTVFGGNNEVFYLGAGAWGTTLRMSNARISGDTSRTGLNFTVDGSGDTITASHATYWITANHTATVNGSYNVIYTAANVNIFDLGRNNDYKSSNGDVFSVSGNTIDVGGNVAIRVNGWGDLVNATTGDVITISNPGNNPTDTVRISNGTVYVTAGSRATINGANNKIYEASGAIVATNGPNQILHDPLILNLAGGKVEASSLESSKANFNMLDTGEVHTAWTTANEGFLVDDSARTGTVTGGANLVSTFDELAASDTDHNGIIDATDAGYTNLRVWVNAEGDGVFRASELETLQQAGIPSINVDDKAASGETNGNTILADSSFTFTDGRTGDIAEIGLQLSAPQDPYAASAGTRFDAMRDLLRGNSYSRATTPAVTASEPAANPLAGFAPAAAELITDAAHPSVRAFACSGHDAGRDAGDFLNSLILDDPHASNPLDAASCADHGMSALADMLAPAAHEVALRSSSAYDLLQGPPAMDTAGYASHDAFGAFTQPSASHFALTAAHDFRLG